MATKRSEAKSATKKDDRDRITVELTPQLRSLLDRVSVLGFYGKDTAQVVRTLAGMQIEKLVRDGVLEKPEIRIEDLEDLRRERGR